MGIRQRPNYARIAEVMLAAAALIGVAIVAKSINSSTSGTNGQIAIATESTLAFPTSTSSSTLSQTCTVVYASGYSGFFLRIVYDGNRTPVAGAHVVATSRVVTPSACYGSYRTTTTQETTTLVTNHTEWYPLDTSFRSSYSIAVTYSGHTYSLSAGFGSPETMTCESLYVPSGRTTSTVTREFVTDCPSSG
jgi:RNase P/RNase MRP subunit p29